MLKLMRVAGGGRYRGSMLSVGEGQDVPSVRTMSRRSHRVEREAGVLSDNSRNEGHHRILRTYQRQRRLKASIAENWQVR